MRSFGVLATLSLASAWAHAATFWAEAYSEGAWRYAGGLGWIYAESVEPGAWAWHSDLGWISALDGDTSGSWFFSPETGWYWTAVDGTYPWMYSLEADAWLHHARFLVAPSMYEHLSHRDQLSGKTFTSMGRVWWGQWVIGFRADGKFQWWDVDVALSGNWDVDSLSINKGSGPSALSLPLINTSSGYLWWNHMKFSEGGTIYWHDK